MHTVLLLFLKDCFKKKSNSTLMEMLLMNDFYSLVVYHGFPPLHSGLGSQLSKTVKVKIHQKDLCDNYVRRVYFCVIGNEFWSINSPTLSWRVWTTSANINRWVSSRSLRMNFFPRAMVSSRWRRNSFIAGSLVPMNRRQKKTCFHEWKIMCLHQKDHPSQSDCLFETHDKIF